MAAVVELLRATAQLDGPSSRVWMGPSLWDCTGLLRVTDALYSKAEADAQGLAGQLPAVRGLWNSCVCLSDGLPYRLASWAAGSATPQWAADAWLPAPFTVTNDTGICGIFDGVRYPAATDDPQAPSSVWGRACAALDGKPANVVWDGGNHPLGVAARCAEPVPSCLVYYRPDAEGRATAVRLEFFDPAQGPPPEDDEGLGLPGTLDDGAGGETSDDEVNVDWRPLAIFEDDRRLF